MWRSLGGPIAAAFPHAFPCRTTAKRTCPSPAATSASPQIEINGETVWRNEKAHPNSHVQELISQEERVVMVLRRAGQYEVLVE